MNEYELYHHGIKGQKWGIRRTAAQLGHRVAGAAKKTGKVLYKGASKAGKVVKKGATKAEKAAVTKVKQVHAENTEKRYYKKLHKKRLSQMTDKEIKDLTDRVKREAALKDAKYESRAQNARKFYDHVAKQPLNTFLATYSGKAVEQAFKKDSNSSSNNKKQDQEGGKKPGEDKSSNKNKPKNIQFDVYIDDDERKKNPFNNPVIIRHGR